MVEKNEVEAIPAIDARGRHIKKRVLKNKSLAVTFNEKELSDFVSGFHKRKKKRRKEAEKNQGEALRRKRLELRKKRRLEKEHALNGGAPPPTDAATDDVAPDESDEHKDDENSEPAASVSGTTTYDNGDIKVTVTTSEISREEEVYPIEKTEAAVSQPVGANKKHNVPVSKKKPFKKVARHKSRPKLQRKRDKRKGNTQSNKKR